jgi:hypothetical protein
MAGAAEVYLINTLINLLDALCASVHLSLAQKDSHRHLYSSQKYECIQLSIQLLAHMSSTISISPPLRQTTHLLRDHLPDVLADIAEGYLLPKDMESTWQTVEAGHYELCMEVKYVNVGLTSACANGHMDIVQLMIAKGASNWKCVLSSACRDGHMNIVQLMIAKGASDWNDGLSNACDNGHMDIIQLMIDKGATTCATCANSKHTFAH